MFYKFNSLIGRISPASQNAAYVPQGLNPNVQESAAFQFDSSTTRAAQVPEFSTQAAAVEGPGAVKGVVPSGSGYANVTKLQKSWHVSESLMVWQKRAARDSLPYWASIALMVVSTGAVFHTLYKMSYPAKKED